MNRITERALNWALETAKDDTHGYSQLMRWGPDYDCSSFIISAYEQAGLKLKEAGASYTGNMKTAFEKCGFRAYPRQPVSRLEPGDVLLNERHHAVMYIGNGKVVAARSSDGFPQSGDQSGREICIQDYYDWPDGGWDCVLRYTGEASPVIAWSDLSRPGGIEWPFSERPDPPVTEPAGETGAQRSASPSKTMAC